MHLSTTHEIIGKKSVKHIGIVDQTVIYGTFFVKDIFASFRDFFGGRSATYEQTLEDARKVALDEISAQAKNQGAIAIIGVHFDTEVLRGTMLAVSARGTAVVVEE
ncbi:MAG: hypothetical protein Greene041636_730 [Parcubacteria group bacterium Greene0416_36]|nr:MAG: hypothetical protein Greene041636_730 [Parcubacteria group bacterium Greene0416_36]